MSEPIETSDDAHQAEPAASPERTPSETSGTGSFVAIGCVLLLVVALVIVMLLLPRLR